jgi:hypothetical protein
MSWAGCGPRVVGYPESVIDTTEHHVYNGFMFIKMERVDDAQREFERALSLTPKSPAANRGMGIVYGTKKDFRSAFHYTDWAVKYAETKHEKAMAYAAMMSLHTLQRGEGWMGKVEEAYRQAITASNELPDPYFQLGIAYKQAYRLGESKLAFEKVTEMSRSLVFEAQEQLKAIQKLEKAMPGSVIGKGIALLDRITRADTAALLIGETRIIEILRAVEARRTGRPSPSEDKAASLPPDVVNHPMKDAISGVVEMNIQGLKTFNDGTFRPDDYLRRADLAMVVADVVTRGDGASLGQKTQGAASPFRDVRADAPYFHAVIVASVRARLMEGEGGIFNPMGTLSGVDALLILRSAEERAKSPSQRSEDRAPATVGSGARG